MDTTPARPSLPLRAAVVGSGGISKQHLSFLSGQVGSNPCGTSIAGRIRLVGVCDLSAVAARYAADRFGADDAFTDIDQMLLDAKPDVVHVLTPPQSHVDLVTRCLRSGVHVICEKPITASAAELEALLAVAESEDRHLTESHNYRFNRGVIQLREALDDGTLGHVREAEIRIALPVTDPTTRFGDPNLPSLIHTMPAGVIHDFTTHLASVLLHLTGPVEFERIGAAWSNHSENPLFTFDDLDALLIGHGPDGSVHGRLRFAADTSPDAFTIRVRGTNGWAETDLFQPYNRTVVPRPVGAQLSPIVNHVTNGASLIGDGIRNLGSKVMQQTPYEGLHRMLGLTYDALISQSPMPVTPQDMLAASRLVDRLLAEDVRL